MRRTRVRSTPWGVDHEENDRVLYSQQVDPDDMPGQPLRDTPQRRDLPEQSERLNPGRLNPNLQQQIDPQMLRRRATIREF